MHLRRVVIPLMLAVGLALATSPVSAVMQEKAPPGFRTVKVKKAAFNLAVPKEWAVINLTRDDADAIFDRLRETAPEITAQLPEDVSALVAQNAVLLAIDDEAASGFAANLNVLQLDGVSGDPTIEDIRPQFESITDDAEFSETEISGRNAIKTEYTLNVGGSPVRGVQYVVLGKNGGLVFTFTWRGEDVPDEFDVMADSIKLK